MSKSDKTVADVENCLEEFKQFLAEGSRQKISLSKPYRFIDSKLGKPHWPANYATEWGEVGPGVYFHFNEEDRLLYIGKAVSIGSRLGAYFKHTDLPSDTTCKIIDPQLEKYGSRAVRVVALPDELDFLAPSLEWFLIQRLPTPVNVQGKRDEQNG